MPHPATVCKQANQRYFRLLKAAYQAAKKDPEYQKELKDYHEHLQACPDCQAAIEELTQTQEEPTP